MKNYCCLIFLIVGCFGQNNDPNNNEVNNIPETEEDDAPNGNGDVSDNEDNTIGKVFTNNIFNGALFNTTRDLMNNNSGIFLNKMQEFMNQTPNDYMNNIGILLKNNITSGVLFNKAGEIVNIIPFPNLADLLNGNYNNTMTKNWREFVNQNFTDRGFFDSWRILTNNLTSGILFYNSGGSNYGVPFTAFGDLLNVNFTDGMPFNNLAELVNRNIANKLLVNTLKLLSNNSKSSVLFNKTSFMNWGDMSNLNFTDAFMKYRDLVGQSFNGNWPFNAMKDIWSNNFTNGSLFKNMQNMWGVNLPLNYWRDLMNKTTSIGILLTNQGDPNNNVTGILFNGFGDFLDPFRIVINLMYNVTSSTPFVDVQSFVTSVLTSGANMSNSISTRMKDIMPDSISRNFPDLNITVSEPFKFWEGMWNKNFSAGVPFDKLWNLLNANLTSKDPLNLGNVLNGSYKGMGIDFPKMMNTSSFGKPFNNMMDLLNRNISKDFPYPLSVFTGGNYLRNILNRNDVADNDKAVSTNNVYRGFPLANYAGANYNNSGTLFGGNAARLISEITNNQSNYNIILPFLNSGEAIKKELSDGARNMLPGYNNSNTQGIQKLFGRAGIIFN